MSRGKRQSNVIPITRAIALRDTLAVQMAAELTPAIAGMATKEFVMNIAPAIRAVLAAKGVPEADQDGIIKSLEAVYVAEHTKRHVKKRAT